MKTILIIVVLTLVGLTAFGFVNQVITAPMIDDASGLSGGNVRSVTIKGEVITPGTYAVGEYATLSDLVDAANGLTSNADHLAFNLDYVLDDEFDTYYIAPMYDHSDVCSTEPIVKVNLNAASAEDLKEVAGFNKTVAGAIVEYRADHPFQSIEEMMDVSGIGEATYESTKSKVTLKATA